VKAFIERHAVPAYFVLAFVISWGGMLLAIGLLWWREHPHDRPRWRTRARSAAATAS